MFGEGLRHSASEPPDHTDLDREPLYPVDDLAPVRTELLCHLDALLEEPLSAVLLAVDLVIGRARRSAAYRWRSAPIPASGSPPRHEIDERYGRGGKGDDRDRAGGRCRLAFVRHVAASGAQLSRHGLSHGVRGVFSLLAMGC